MCALVTARICIGGRLARVRARPSLLHERERVALKARKGKSSTRADIGRAHAPMPTPIRSACAARCLYACNSAHTDMRNNPTGRCAQLSMMRCSAGGSAPSLWARCSAVWPAPLMHQVCEPSGLRGKRRAPRRTGGTCPYAHQDECWLLVEQQAAAPGRMHAARRTCHHLHVPDSFSAAATQVTSEQTPYSTHSRTQS